MKRLIIIAMLLSGCAGTEYISSYANYGGTYTVRIYDDFGGLKIMFSDVVEISNNEVGNQLKLIRKGGMVTLINSGRYTVEVNQ